MCVWAPGISAAAARKTWQCEGRVWAERLHGPQAWMSHSTWTHSRVLESRCKNKNSFTSAVALQDKFAIHTPQLLWHARGHITLESDTCSLTSSPDDPGPTSPLSCGSLQIKSVIRASCLENIWMALSCALHIFAACWEHMNSECTTWIIHLHAYVLKHSIDVSLRHTWMTWRTDTGSDPKHKYTEGSWSEGPKFSSLHCLWGLHLAAVWWQSTSSSIGH